MRRQEKRQGWMMMEKRMVTYDKIGNKRKQRGRARQADGMKES